MQISKEKPQKPKNEIQQQLNLTYVHIYYI